MKRWSLPVVLLGQALALRLHAVHVLPGGLGLLLGLLQLGLHVGDIATSIHPVRLGILKGTGGRRQEAGGRETGAAGDGKQETADTGDRKKQTQDRRQQETGDRRRQTQERNSMQGAAGDTRQETWETGTHLHEHLSRPAGRLGLLHGGILLGLIVIN